MSIRLLAEQLKSGDISTESLLQQCLNLAKSPASSGVFIQLNEQVMDTARWLDQQRRQGKPLPPLAGVPLTLKDLFNVRGEQTCAGSVVLKAQAACEREDAEVVAHLRTAGLLFMGRVNMSEFALSGMGLNPHYPPLYSVWDRQTGRLPGGSSSGTAVSVALGIVPASLGSDTAGSCRIPAAFNGIVGFKPSHGRLSLQGIYPLSPSADAPGPLATDVDSCYLLDQLMQGQSFQSQAALPTITPKNINALRFWIPAGRVLADLDKAVALAFEQAVDRLQQAGATLIKKPLPTLDACLDMFFQRNTSAYEVWQQHRELIEAQGAGYDPYVHSRVLAGQTLTEREQQQRYAEKTRLVYDLKQAIKNEQVDALLYPTVACVPPVLEATRHSTRMGEINMRCLRNTATVNYFDGCAISLPCPETFRIGSGQAGHIKQAEYADQAPVGLMLSSYNGQDDALLAVAASVESLFKAG